MFHIGDLRPTGALGIKVIRGNVSPSIAWKIKNVLRRSFLKGWLGWHVIAPLANRFGVMTAMGRLSLVHIKANGQRVDYGVVSYQVITDAGVAYLVDDWDAGANDINLFKYHGCGTGVGAEAAGDTALGTESTTALNPDSTRATGTQSQPSANILQSVGTLTFDASAAVTEHGLFTQAATGGGTLWDRSVFSAVNVASGDSIQFTYQCTINSGG